MPDMAFADNKAVDDTTLTALRNTVPATTVSSTRTDTQVEKGRAEVNVEREKQEKELRRRLDMTLIPIVLLMLLSQCLDSGALGAAKTNGIEADLHINQRQFNTASPSGTVGYMLFQIPSNLIITQIHPGRYLSFWVAAWSIVAFCHAFVHSFSALMVVQFFLGVCDAPFFVGAMHLLSSWYTTREIALRMSVLLGCLIITLTLVGPLSAGILAGLGGKLGWRGWRWLFLIFGLGGLIIATLGLIFLPDYPTGAGKPWWLTSEQKAVGKKRMDEDRVGEKKVERNKLWQGFKDACEDKRTWMFILVLTCRCSFSGIDVYFPSLIHSFTPAILPHPAPHISLQTITLLLISPPAFLGALAALFTGYSSDRRSERCLHIIIPVIFALIGLVLSAATLNSVARYVATFLYVPGSVAGSAMAWSWVASSLNETAEKKACGIAIFGVVSGLGGVWSPFFFKGHDKPRYLLAFIALSCFAVLQVICCWDVRTLLKKANGRLKREAEERGDADVKLYIL